MSDRQECFGRYRGASSGARRGATNRACGAMADTWNAIVTKRIPGAYVPYTSEWYTGSRVSLRRITTE